MEGTVRNNLDRWISGVQSCDAQRLKHLGYRESEASVLTHVEREHSILCSAYLEKN